MANYLGQPDFIPDIQPFQPNWDVVDKTLRLKQGSYDQGYSSLQGTYSGLLNMPQLKQDQISKRDKFLKDAFKNLGDLSSVDLSLPENVASANNVFAPLYNDTEFLGNSSISKHYQQQEQYADSLRQQDGGKDFSIDNLNYVRQQKAEYINDGSPDSWKKYYSNKRYYEPYYDTKKEIREVMEKFKPSSSSLVRLNGFYKETVDDKSWRQSEIKDYLNGVLSDKAKRQLQIEATVRLGDPNTIASMYRDTANKDISQLQDKINDTDNLIKTTKDPVQRDKLIDLKNQLSASIQSIGEDSDKISKGDLNYIKANQEKLAYNLYYNSVIDGVSKGFEHQDIKQEITEDTVAFGMWKDAQDMKRFMIGEQNENYRANLREAGEDRRFNQRLKVDAFKAQKEVKDKNGEAVVIDLPAGPGDVLGTTSLTGLDDQVRVVQRQGYQDSVNLKEHISEVSGVPLNKLTAKQVKMYMESPKGKQDNAVLEFNQRSNMRHLTIDDASNTRRQAQQYAESKMPGYVAKSKQVDNVLNNLAKTDTYTLQGEDGSSITVSPKRVMEMVANKEFSIAPKRGDAFNISIGGKSYRQADNKTGTLGGIAGTAAEVLKFLNSNKDTKKYNEYIAQYFGEKKVDQRKAFTFRDDSDNVKATKNKLTSLTGLDMSKLTEVSYSPNADRNKIYFSVQDPEGKIDTEAVVNKLTTKGYPTTYNEQTGQFEVTNKSLDTHLDPFANMSGYSRQLISTLENRTGKPGSKYQSTFYNFNNNGVKSAYRIDKKFGSDNDNIYYLYPSGSNTPVRETFRSAFDAYQFSQQMAANPDLANAIMK